MEVVVKMEGTKAKSTGTPDSSPSSSSMSPSPETETLMLGRFTMVCRDSKTQKARKVPRLIVETDEERVLWDLGEGTSCHQPLRSQADDDSPHKETEGDVYARLRQSSGKPQSIFSIYTNGADLASHLLKKRGTYTNSCWRSLTRMSLKSLGKSSCQ